MRYLRLCHVDAFRFEFLPLSSERYAAAKFWHDLEALDGLIIRNTKFFVSHDKSRPVYSEPRICLTTCVEAASENEAIRAAVKESSFCLAQLTVLYNCAFTPRHDRTFFTRVEQPTDFSMFEVGIEWSGSWVGHVGIHDPIAKTKRPDGLFEGPAYRYKVHAFDGVITHEEYLPHFFRVHVPEVQNVKLTANQLKRSEYPPEAPLFTVPEDSLHVVLFGLYGEAIGCANPVDAFAPLWKLVEMIEKAAPRTPLLTAEQLEELGRNLSGFEDSVRARILGSAKGMDAKTQATRFVEGLRLVFPAWDGDEDHAKQVVRRSRDVRGRLFHPTEAVDPYHIDILRAFWELRALVSDVCRSVYPRRPPECAAYRGR